jgi:glutamate--cysteine ligase
MQPVSRLDEIEWVPKERYGIMRESLKDKGAATHAMMKQTASIQISLDYVSESDAVEKFRLAMALAPFFAAMYANSPVSEGRLNGLLSKRSAVWLETATDRSGAIEAVFHGDFSFAKYVEYALSVPALFIVRQGRWIALKDRAFRDFLEKGHEEYRATLGDWELHLTTLFTDARLKHYIEIRTIDCQKTALGLSAPALIKGLFYDDEARRHAWTLVKGASAAERRTLALEIPQKALKAGFQNSTVLDVARKLITIADEGLRRLKEDPNYLTPLKELILEKGKCPAELLIDRLGDSTAQETVRRIIDATALVTTKNEVCSPS